jgi:hypothetical protein
MAKKNPQVNLHKHLVSGRMDLAEKDLMAGASLFMERLDMTGAEISLVTSERKDLWLDAIKAPTAASVKWLTQHDPTFSDFFLVVDTLSNDALWKHLVRSAAPDTLDWFSKQVLPQAPPFSMDRLGEMLSGALDRSDAAGLAWLAQTGLNPEPLWKNPQRPLIFQVVHEKQRTWVLNPANLVARLEVLVALGLPAQPHDVHIEDSPLASMLAYYKAWQDSDNEPIKAEMNSELPRAWDLLVQAGGDPEAVGKKGQVVWHAAAGTPLIDRYLAQRRAAQTQALSEDMPAGRRRHRP